MELKADADHLRQRIAIAKVKQDHGLLTEEEFDALLLVGVAFKADLDLWRYLNKTFGKQAPRTSSRALAGAEGGRMTRKDLFGEARRRMALPETREPQQRAGGATLKAVPSEPKKGLIISGREFIAGFTPPDYAIDGVLRRRFAYSCTGRTGDGKTAVMLRTAAHVVQGIPLGSAWRRAWSRSLPRGRKPRRYSDALDRYGA